MNVDNFGTSVLFTDLFPRGLLPVQAVDVWRLHRDSALLSCGACLQGLEPISLEVGNNQQGCRNDVSLTEVSPNVYPWTTRPVEDVSVVVWDMSTGTGVHIPWRLVINKDAITMYPRLMCP